MKLVRGMEVTDTGAQSVPVGPATLGRIFLTCLGRAQTTWDLLIMGNLPHPPPAPKFTDLKPNPRCFETGIKVVDTGSYRRGSRWSI